MNYINIIKLAGKQLLFVFVMFILYSSSALGQQDVTIKGTITSDTDELGLPGVSVVMKGTTRGVVTDLNGTYTITVPSNAVLVFSFIGYKPQEVPVEGRTVINLTLNEDVTEIGEVVVTALGITRQEKSLGYSVGKVSGSDMVKVPQENVLNALAGKVSGVTINSTGGTGSSVSMVIRGATSLFSDNQPLFVIDGVPVANSLNNVTQMGRDNRVDYGNAISDLNPEDIENISVLKGPSAAALYGSRAGNGVVVVTTKSGKNSKGMRVDISSNTVFDVPYKSYKQQKWFAHGPRPETPDMYPEGHIFDIRGASFASGMPLDKGYYAIQWDSPTDGNGDQIPSELVSYPNNMRNFVNTGITSTNSISVSNNNEWINYRIGVTNMTNKGVIPGTDLHRNNISTAVQVKVNKSLTLSSNINYGRNWANNRPSGNRGDVLEAVVNFPVNYDIRRLENYWVPGKEGFEVVNMIPGTTNNPYFMAHEIKNGFSRDRMFGNVMLEWQITSKLSAMARMTMDLFSQRIETKIPLGWTREPKGYYGLMNTTGYERNFDFLIKWDDRVGDFSYTISAGGNEMYTKATSVVNKAKQEAGLIVPNVFKISNIKPEALEYASDWSQKAVQSLYAFINLGWKDMVYLDLTGRNDWSSTLPKNNRSYFYPSASLSLLVNQMVDLGPKISLIKLRGGWAQVGSDTSPYQLLSTYNSLDPWGSTMRLSKSGTILVPNLKPELATSMEFGTNLGFFDNRLRFEGTYFMVDNKNQIIQNVPNAPSSGSSTSNINMGLVQSKGWEFTIGGTPIKTSDWMWDIDVNVTRVRTTLKELAPSIEKIEFWKDNAAAWTYVGEEIGDIYGAAIERIDDPNSPYHGFPVLDATGGYTEIPIEQTKNKIGNYNPDFILGLNSTVSYKNLSLSWTLDWRCGGQFFSQTERRMKNWGGSTRNYEEFAVNPEGRTGADLKNWIFENDHLFRNNMNYFVGGPTKERGGFVYAGVNDGCFFPGVFVDGATGEITENFGGEGTVMRYYIVMDTWDFAEGSLFAADYIKLREITLTYRVPSKFLEQFRIKGLALSVYSRNIMLWTKAKIGIDPERAFGIEASTDGKRGTQMRQGMEQYNLEPWVMPIGVKLNLTF